MAKTSKCAISCMRLTSKFLVKHTLEREQLPCCFLESYTWIFYNKAGPMMETLFHEFELTEEYTTWVQHLTDQKPLIIRDKNHPRAKPGSN